MWIIITILPNKKITPLQYTINITEIIPYIPHLSFKRSHERGTGMTKKRRKGRENGTGMTKEVHHGGKWTGMKKETRVGKEAQRWRKRDMRGERRTWMGKRDMGGKRGTNAGKDLHWSEKNGTEHREICEASWGRGAPEGRETMKIQIKIFRARIRPWRVKVWFREWKRKWTHIRDN